MPGMPLEGCRVLVAEDEYLIADDVGRTLRKAGAVVVGPVATVAAALALIETEPALDAAVLDVNLRGEPAYPVADALGARGIPYVFATGYDAGDLAAAYRHVPCWEKPADAAALVLSLAGRLGRDGRRPPPDPGADGSVVQA